MIHFVPTILYSSPGSIYARSSLTTATGSPMIQEDLCVFIDTNTMGIGRHKPHSVGVVIPLFHSIPFHHSIPLNRLSSFFWAINGRG